MRQSNDATKQEAQDGEDEKKDAEPQPDASAE